MKLSLDDFEGRYPVEAYSEEGVKIAGRWLRTHLMITPAKLIDDWDAPAPDEMRLDDLDRVLDPPPDVMVLGTGRRLAFPPAKLTAELAQRGIGLEVMDTEAACRTYNILLAEGRRVAVALIIGD